MPLLHDQSDMRGGCGGLGGEIAREEEVYGGDSARDGPSDHDIWSLRS